jgi:hypothetical protein
VFAWDAIALLAIHSVALGASRVEYVVFVRDLFANRISGFFALDVLD